MSVTLDIRLKRVNKIYHDEEAIIGYVIIESRNELKHEGLTLSMEGNVTMQLSAKNVGILEAFYSSAKPVLLTNCVLEIAKPGKFPAGRTELPFEIPLKPRTNRTLYETYHGVFISIQYYLKCEMKRSLLNKDLQKVLEFIVEYKEQKADSKAVPVNFNITPESLQNVKYRKNMPNFVIKGRIDSTVCNIMQPFTGELCIEKCDATIRSVELQLVRVETCGCSEGYSRDATEIQNIQIGEGDVCRNILIPIHMIFPRLFTCPTLVTNNFKIEFEVNVVVVFEDEHIITENFPIVIVRA
ncbi:vacuolar protein sorting-associated protein 26C isoform X2 [Parasteatoda tepidariorum]|uniref:Vacuolar protein sorting-associated protein 26C n=1 Tax=Parasteatoda tepidariorum TaxID=114398 RepID=A0A2L2XYN5_PARTP|nr:vacuolar protein sorting-associated protein 26C isoform X2 [Parasteatoda tepidariorum]